MGLYSVLCTELTGARKSAWSVHFTKYSVMIILINAYDVDVSLDSNFYGMSMLMLLRSVVGCCCDYLSIISWTAMYNM